MRLEQAKQLKRWRSLPILFVDFDGVIHSYSSGWQNYETCTDPPVPGAFDVLFEYNQHFQVKILSGRAESKEGAQAIREYLCVNATYIQWFGDERYVGLKWIKITDRKNGEFVAFIDDRAIHFDGVNWPSVEDLEKFKPWCKQ